MGSAKLLAWHERRRPQVREMGKKRCKRQVADEAAGAEYDALGELISRYAVSMGGVLIASAIGALVGAGLVVFALSRERISLLFLLIGAGLILVAGALVVTSAAGSSCARRAFALSIP